MATTNNIPRELNWVEKRAACTAAQIFNELCSGIESDVAAINSTGQLAENNHFSAEMSQSGTAIVIGQPKALPRKRVIIAVRDQEVDVRDEATPSQPSKWSATVALNDEGRCILKLVKDGSEVEQWQFRKKALQGLFFGAG